MSLIFHNVNDFISVSPKYSTLCTQSIIMVDVICQHLLSYSSNINININECLWA